MKTIAVLCLLVAVVSAAPQTPQTADKDAQIIRFESDSISDTAYSYGYDTSNGLHQQEKGELANVGTENEVMRVVGEFSYTGPDGVVYKVTYKADENGFQPLGEHLPVA